MFQSCQDSLRKIKVFEGRRVCLGAQNRPQERQKENKIRLRRRTKINENKQAEAGKRCPREFEEESGSPLWSIQKPQRAPKRNPREPQSAFKTTIGSKMLIFQKSSSRHGEIKVLEGGRVSLGVQNRPQEAPKEDKKRHRKKITKRREEKGIKNEKKNDKKSFKNVCHRLTRLVRSSCVDSLVARGP